MSLLYDDEVKIFWVLCGSDNNNAYLLVCPETNESVVIDAPLNPGELIEEAKKTQVKRILITHHHRDHLEGLEEIKKATGAAVGVHKADADSMMIKPDILMEDGDIVKVGTMDIKLIHTPGHTPGSSCYLSGSHLFSGDTLFAGGVGHTQSVEDLQMTFKNIAEKLYTLSDAIFLLPGHGKGSVLGKEKKDYIELVEKHPELFPPIPEISAS